MGKLGGEATPGTPGNANISFTGGNDGGTVVGEVLCESGASGSGVGGANAETATESIFAGDAVAALPP